MPAGVPPVGLDSSERSTLAGWMLLAVGSLAAAGFLALLLPTLRSPGAEHWFPWPIGTFFQVTLVTHVVMAFVVWFLAMLGGLTAAVCLGLVFALLRVTHGHAIGLAAGTAGSGVGAAQVTPLGEGPAAFAAIGIALNGLITALLAPLVAAWLG